jgi:glycerol-3-phosphate dehydrogenase
MTDPRANSLREAQQQKQWDIVVIGGGATGLGAAVDAASRGYRTLLVERDDFAKGTSSRSTKLAHGGVRYLEQLNITLVLDALRERGYMLRNAPHIAHKLGFVVPIYNYPALPYYGLGLKLYERMSGSLSIGQSQILSREETIQRLPTIATQNLKGGVLYFDGQFDDTSYAIALMRTLEDRGGIALNYAEVISLLHRNNKLEGLRVRDKETGNEFEVLAKAIINATGIFAEHILAQDIPGNSSIFSLSRGAHVVLPKEFLSATDAVMIPRTSDGRVLFSIPWHNHVLVGTTDVPAAEVTPEPHASQDETTFLRDHIQRYLGRRPQSSEILSVWAGLRPLLKSGNAATAKLSRDHKVLVSATGLITITGGKWTTYRRMAEDAINHAAKIANLTPSPCKTATLKLHGWAEPSTLSTEEETDITYGSDLTSVRALSDVDPTLNNPIHPQLPYLLRHILWAIRHEKARTTEDVLARRTRALFLNARAAIEAAPQISQLLASELNRTEAQQQADLQSFLDTAQGYIYRD